MEKGNDTMRPDLNVDLLDKTLDHIETLAAFQAEGADLAVRWDQATWGWRTECGTALCFAGHAAVLAGHRLEPCAWSDADDPYIALVVEGGGSIGTTAQTELGLTKAEAAALFKSSNTLSRVRQVVEAIKAGELR